MNKQNWKVKDYIYKKMCVAQYKNKNKCTHLLKCHFYVAITKVSLLTCLLPGRSPNAPENPGLLIYCEVP